MVSRNFAIIAEHVMAIIESLTIVTVYPVIKKSYFCFKGKMSSVTTFRATLNIRRMLHGSDPSQKTILQSAGHRACVRVISTTS